MVTGPMVIGPAYHLPKFCRNESQKQKYQLQIPRHLHGSTTKQQSIPHSWALPSAHRRQEVLLLTDESSHPFEEPWETKICVIMMGLLQHRFLYKPVCLGLSHLIPLQSNPKPFQYMYRHTKEWVGSASNNGLMNVSDTSKGGPFLYFSEWLCHFSVLANGLVKLHTVMNMVCINAWLHILTYYWLCHSRKCKYTEEVLQEEYKSCNYSVSLATLEHWSPNSK